MTRPLGGPPVYQRTPLVGQRLRQARAGAQTGAGAMQAASPVPQIMAPGHETPSQVAWRAVPSTYLICDQDHTISPALQRRLAGRATCSVTWPSDHTPFVREPERVAGFLASAATGPDAGPEGQRASGTHE